MPKPQPRHKVAVPRPSATVVLVRDGGDRPEVLVVRRHAKATFGAVYVFPGGVLEPADAQVHAYCDGLSPAAADRRLDLDSGGLDYYSAAVRELFEETGVLLASAAASDAERAAARQALNDGALDWRRFVVDGGLRLQCQDLHYFSFWITPEEAPKRFSTRFFLAALPTGQQASHCGGELTDSCWMPASDILAADTAGELQLHFVTRQTLLSVADLQSVEALLDWARAFAESGVTCHQPAAVPKGA